MERVIFMGTPEFAVPSLRVLHDAYRVVLVVTQPDRQAGRGRALVPPPVKVVAQELGLPVYQPHTLRTPEALAQLQEATPHVIVVAAYGQILRPNVLALPAHGCVNVHASLLPRHRGAAPIAAAILAGDEVTGITIMLMDAGMDTGPILAQAEEPIGPEDTTATLTVRLAERGARLLGETLPRWLGGEIHPQPQDEMQATKAPLIKKEDGLIDWGEPALAIWRRVRAYNPWPGAHTYWQGRRLRIVGAEPLPNWQGCEPPGTVLPTQQGAAVVTGQGALLLRDLQLEGRSCTDCLSFVCGQQTFVGSRLGIRVECV